MPKVLQHSPLLTLLWYNTNYRPRDDVPVPQPVDRDVLDAFMRPASVIQTFKCTTVFIQRGCPCRPRTSRLV